MSRAVALIGPVLLAEGVVERRSYWQLLHGWLVAGHAHRTLWPLPARRLPLSALKPS